jgi:chorismate synthase
VNNTFGELFRVSTWGESHGEAVGCVVDGCPAGLGLSEKDVQKELDRRKPGTGRMVSQRRESDRVRILSGVFEGKTLGTPISMIVFNEDAKPEDYEKIKDTPRPGHADFTCRAKFGHVDFRGGGRASARETVARVAAGAVAKKLLGKVEVTGRVIEMGDVKKAKAERDSVGGIVEVVTRGVPAGIGEPVFDKLDADIARAMMSIGAVKWVEIGRGFESARLKGSEMNDEFVLKNGEVVTKTNNCGGILGGISTGGDIVVRIAVKPTSSIRKEQRTVDLETMEETTISVGGRHDPCICPRIVPVAEAMMALVLADHMMRSGKI